MISLDALLTKVAGAWPVSLDGAQRECLAGFVRLLLRWNARINLTGARTDEDVVGEHLPDSFAMAHVVPPRAMVLDVGAGGGFPAIPFAVLRPDCAVNLLEPRAKRAAFLRTAARELGLARVTVEAIRVEDLGASRGTFDVTSSRATFALGRWVEIAPRLVKPGGRILLFANDPTDLPADARPHLIQEVRYTTLAGRPRWLAALGR